MFANKEDSKRWAFVNPNAFTEDLRHKNNRLLRSNIVSRLFHRVVSSSIVPDASPTMATPEDETFQRFSERLSRVFKCQLAEGTDCYYLPLNELYLREQFSTAGRFLEKGLGEPLPDESFDELVERLKKEDVITRPIFYDDLLRQHILDYHNGRSGTLTVYLRPIDHRRLLRSLASRYGLRVTTKRPTEDKLKFRLFFRRCSFTGRLDKGRVLGVEILDKLAIEISVSPYSSSGVDVLETTKSLREILQTGKAKANFRGCRCSRCEPIQSTKESLRATEEEVESSSRYCQCKGYGPTYGCRHAPQHTHNPWHVPTLVELCRFKLEQDPDKEEWPEDLVEFIYNK